jgi:hypothetical protein
MKWQAAGRYIAQASTDLQHGLLGQLEDQEQASRGAKGLQEAHHVVVAQAPQHPHLPRRRALHLRNRYQEKLGLRDVQLGGCVLGCAAPALQQLRYRALHLRLNNLFVCEGLWSEGAAVCPSGLQIEDYRGLVAMPPFHVFISGAVVRCPFPGTAEQLDLHLPLA